MVGETPFLALRIYYFSEDKNEKLAKVELEIDDVRTFLAYFNKDEEKCFRKVVEAIVTEFKYAQGGYTAVCEKELAITVESYDNEIKGKKANDYNCARIYAEITEKGVKCKILVGIEAMGFEAFEKTEKTLKEDEFIQKLIHAIINKDFSVFF